MECIGVAVEGRNGVMGMLEDRAVEHYEYVVVGVLLHVALESVAIQLDDVVFVSFLPRHLGDPVSLRVKSERVAGEQDSLHCGS